MKKFHSDITPENLFFDQSNFLKILVKLIVLIFIQDHEAIPSLRSSYVKALAYKNYGFLSP